MVVYKPYIWGKKFRQNFEALQGANGARPQVAQKIASAIKWRKHRRTLGKTGTNYHGN